MIAWDVVDSLDCYLPDLFRLLGQILMLTQLIFDLVNMMRLENLKSLGTCLKLNGSESFRSF